jgi:hypothetical protein
MQRREVDWRVGHAEERAIKLGKQSRFRIATRDGMTRTRLVPSLSCWTRNLLGVKILRSPTIERGDSGGGVSLFKQ